ncbi:unnamed protein product, partial [Nesidiocoris tenuis]
MFAMVKREFPKLFSDKIGRFNKGLASLQLMEGAEPKFVRARPIPFSLRPAVEAEIDRLVKAGILEPVEYSRFGTPIVPVLKKGGGIRLCGDYKVTINPILKVDQYPLPTAEMLFQRVQGSKVFAKLDLSQAYQQMMLDEESKELTTITTHKGLFRYRRLPFGVASGPAKFQRCLEQLIDGLDGVAAMLDDILVGGKDENELMSRINAVLTRLQDAGLTLAENKCEIGKASVVYLGFRIDKAGLHTTDEKVRAVADAPKPEDVKTLQSFLGFVAYISKFIPNAANVLSPLYKLLKKDSKWQWDDKCDAAFNKIKELVLQHRSLAHYDPALPLRLTVDASNRGVAAILSQHQDNIDQPIAFSSRTLSPAEESYSSIHKEALAIIHAVKKFHIYLFGRRWTLVTDHKPLVTIFGPKNGIPACAANRLQRWAWFLSNYTYDIEYVSTKKNSADWLSRAPLPDTVIPDDDSDLTMNYVFENDDLPLEYKHIVKYSKQDPIIIKVMGYVKHGWPEKVEAELVPFHRFQNEFHVDKEILMRGYRVVIPEKLRHTVLTELHKSHLGIVKVKSLARAYVWWPRLDQEIESYIQGCVPCAQHKENPPKNSLVPWEWPTAKWSRLHIDYLGPIHDHYILVVVDSHTKWLDAFPTKSMTSSVTIRLLRGLFSTFGYPKVLVADNFSAFVSDEFQKFLSQHGVEFKSGAPYSPRTNGAAENAVKTVKRAVLTALDEVDSKNSLDEVLQRFLLDYRNTKHVTTGVSPAEALLGGLIRNRLDLIRPPGTADRVASQQAKQIENHGGQEPNLWCIRDAVWVKNYRKGDCAWLAGIIDTILGPRRVKVYVPELDRTLVRHVHQVRKRVPPYFSPGSLHQASPSGSSSVLDNTSTSRSTPRSATSSSSTSGSTNSTSGRSPNIVDTPLMRPSRHSAVPTSPQTFPRGARRSLFQNVDSNLNLDQGSDPGENTPRTRFGRSIRKPKRFGLDDS